MASDEMLSWLKATIEGDKALAEENLGEVWAAADDRDEGFFIEIEDAGAFGKACGCCITGTLCEVEAKHVALHDPRDTIARCEAELSVLDLFEKHGYALGGAYFGALHDALGRLVVGYRHRACRRDTLRRKRKRKRCTGTTTRSRACASGVQTRKSR
ncbi:hypothetical protein FXF51_06010 [Nonomuraea sp. PA05]|uniref:DUF6221 family protein n=1 Tax=Nonomuraea sp. PA05 TaxID=2604466 RepID=UPI0011D76007|nr:DUF6221 family protein [Nonomuraea sp. PA05]TYB69714.1 hypothetical protein FXF51_06010 [Nonomuraea sp. PA05]